MGDPVALPILCANVELSSYPGLSAFVHPSMITEVGGLRVGLLGIVTDNPNYYSPAFLGIFLDPYTSAWIAAEELQAAGCDVVIAISHLGLLPDVMGLSTVPGIDIIVGGHSHDEFFAPNINGKTIVQAGELGKNLGVLRVAVDDASGAITVLGNVLNPVDSGIREDPSLLRYLNDLRKGIGYDPRFGPVYSRHIAKAMWDHEEEWLDGDPHRDASHRDTPLGNLVADAIRTGVESAGYPVDFALEINGYIGDKIYAGKVTGADVMRVVPYGYDPVSGLGFKIQLVDLYGLEILAALEYSVHMAEYTDELSAQVSGLTFEYDSGNPPYSRIDIASMLINGYPFNPYGMYTVAMNEGLIAFLAGLGLDLTGRVTDPSSDLFEYSLVSDYMGELNHLAYTSEGRIIDQAQLP
jgi:5'-nucleotidase